jgi:hypothetical protein
MWLKNLEVLKVIREADTFYFLSEECCELADSRFSFLFRLLFANRLDCFERFAEDWLELEQFELLRNAEWEL